MATIVLTEDDEAVRTFVARALEIDAHEVIEAENGAEGLEALRRAKDEVSLLLTDIKMPEMDGIELAHTAASEFPMLKILMMTGYADQRERAGPLANIVVDVVQKPFTLGQIREYVAKALAA